MGALGLICIGMIALYLLRTGCQWFIARWGHVMGARMEADMRSDLFDQYQRLSFSYYDKNNTGEMMSRLVTDLFDVSELAHHGPENIFICSLKIVGSFALLFLINVPLTLIMLACTAIMAAYATWINYRKRVIFTENRRTMAGVNSRIQDALGGMRVVKSFGNEMLEAKKFEHTNRLFVDTKERSYKFLGRFHAVNSLFTGLLYTIVVVGGGYFMVQGWIAAHRPGDLCPLHRHLPLADRAARCQLRRAVPERLRWISPLRRNHGNRAGRARQARSGRPGEGGKRRRARRYPL